MAQDKTGPITNDASQGLVTSRDPSTLKPGELTVAESCEYRVGSPHLYKLPGRDDLNAALGGPVLAITKLQYDSADDVLVADANGKINEAEADLTPTFTSTPVTGLSTTAVPQYTGFRDVWIRCNGVDDNYLRESGSVVGPRVIGTGTVSGAAGQAIVTGTGTIFTTQLLAGSLITFSTGELATVLTVDSSTQITLTGNLGTTLSAATFTYATAGQGNWRTVGMATALVPSFSGVTTFSGGSQTLRPTTYANQTNLPQQGLVGYHDPSLAFDGPGIGNGQVSGTAGQQVLVGTATIFTTQLSPGAQLIFSTGEVGIVQSIAADTQLTLTTNIVTTMVSATFTFTNATTASDPLDTRAWANTGDADHTKDFNAQIPVVPRTATCTWKYTTDLAYPGRILYVRHNGACVPPDQGPTFGPEGMTFHVEYSQNGGTSWSTLHLTHQPFVDIQEHSVNIPDSLVLTNNLWIRSTIVSNQALPVSNHWLDVTHAIYDIKVSTGASGAYSAKNDIYYAVSEVYVDSDGVEHQSNMGLQVGAGGQLGGLFISAATLQNATSLTINLPARINPLASRFIIWRSVDTPGGGFPVMYAVGNAKITDTQWTDNFSIRPDDTAALAELEQYKVLEILYSDGTSSLASYYSQPPLSFMTLVFQGCLVYFPSVLPAVPSTHANARKVFYSLPATVTINSLEQVPEQYFLDFQTPHNDQVKSGAITNGGRSMLVFFENYTMLVNFLPQGADPGGFNNTVKEYVSNVRGCAGAMACTEFTLPSGQTLVASVDGLGLWVTNGVNLVEEWSNDLDWPTTFGGVDLTAVILVDKPHKRRIEMLYTDADGNRKEYHFFYGRMKEGIDGKAQPLVSGPHATGTRSKHYTLIDGVWVGFSGGSSTVGKVFLEDVQAADDSQGYNANGDVPTIWASGDIYVGGISRAHIVESASVKFGVSPQKDITMVGSFTRDAGVTVTVTKTIKGESGAFPKTIFWHRYGDFHRIRFEDISNTEMPPFVNYVLDIRPSGMSRDK